MHYSLIGMSNIGKSFWSKRIAAAHGYTRFDCDTDIETMLGAELTRQGFKGIHDVAQWMGHPYAPQYPEASRQYLDCEAHAIGAALDAIAATPDRNTVIDTTGSVIYLSPDLLARLRAATTVVYLEATDAHKAQMFQNFVSFPKPVIWGDAYRPAAGEGGDDALKRCYGDLLNDRDRRYRALAHVTIPYDAHKNHRLDPAELLRSGQTKAAFA